MPLNINGRIRACRTEMLTGATTNTTLRIHRWYPRRCFIVCTKRNHVDCTSRSVVSTVSASHSIGYYDTVLLYPYRMTNLNRRFLFFREFHNGTIRADFRTMGTLRTTIATVVAHLWLHEAV